MFKLARPRIRFYPFNRRVWRWKSVDRAHSSSTRTTTWTSLARVRVRNPTWRHDCLPEMVNPVVVSSFLIKAMVEKAPALDDRLAAAHDMHARILSAWDWDWAGADAAFQRAIALNPSYPDAHVIYGQVLAIMGRSDAALAAVQRGPELDPHNAFFQQRRKRQEYERRAGSRRAEPEGARPAGSGTLVYCSGDSDSRIVSRYRSSDVGPTPRLEMSIRRV